MRRWVPAAWILLIGIATFALHEAAHGLASWALGYPTFIKVNSSGLISGEYRSAFDRDLTTLVGPIITILQAVLGVSLVCWARWRYGFTMVLAAFMMRTLAAVASLRRPNDEARLGVSWGLGYWTLHATVIVFLLLLTIVAARQVRPQKSTIVINVGLILLSMTIVILSEPYLPRITL